MNTHALNLPEGELTFEQDGEWIHGSRRVPDPKWRTTDSHGHEHRHTEGPDLYPTLTTVQGEPYWCADCRDEHQDSWYECRQCGEKITPGTRVDTTPKYIAGPVHYYWNGDPITTEQAGEIITEMQRLHDEATRLKTRPEVGAQVRLEDTTVTVVPTEEHVPDTHVTVMHHGTGALETVALDALRTKGLPGLG